jgi:hypothetical protein
MNIKEAVFPKIDRERLGRTKWRTKHTLFLQIKHTHNSCVGYNRAPDFISQLLFFPFDMEFISR